MDPVDPVNKPVNSWKNELGELSPLTPSELSTNSSHDSLLSLEVQPGMYVLGHIQSQHARSTFAVELLWCREGHGGVSQAIMAGSSHLLFAIQTWLSRMAEAGGDTRTLYTHTFFLLAKFPYCWTSGFQNAKLMSTFYVMPLSYWY